MQVITQVDWDAVRNLAAWDKAKRRAAHRHAAEAERLRRRYRVLNGFHCPACGRRTAGGYCSDECRRLDLADQAGVTVKQGGNTWRGRQTGGSTVRCAKGTPA